MNLSSYEGLRTQAGSFILSREKENRMSSSPASNATSIVFPMANYPWQEERKDIGSFKSRREQI